MSQRAGESIPGEKFWKGSGRTDVGVLRTGLGGRSRQSPGATGRARPLRRWQVW